MDAGKRKLLKALPLAAMAPALMLRMGKTEVQGYELVPEKKYVFRIADPQGFIEESDLVPFRETLQKRGINATVIAGDVEIYEMS